MRRASGARPGVRPRAGSSQARAHPYNRERERDATPITKTPKPILSVARPIEPKNLDGLPPPEKPTPLEEYVALPPGNLADRRAVIKALKFVRQHHSALYFKEPVDPVRLSLPTYPDIVKNPMDLRTMVRKAENGDYGSPADLTLVEADANLMFDNVSLFNGTESFMNKYVDALRPVIANKIDTLKMGSTPPSAERHAQSMATYERLRAEYDENVMMYPQRLAEYERDLKMYDEAKAAYQVAMAEWQPKMDEEQEQKRQQDAERIRKHDEREQQALLLAWRHYHYNQAMAAEARYKLLRPHEDVEIFPGYNPLSHPNFKKPIAPPDDPSYDALYRPVDYSRHGERNKGWPRGYEPDHCGGFRHRPESFYGYGGPRMDTYNALKDGADNHATRRKGKEADVPPPSYPKCVQDVKLDEWYFKQNKLNHGPMMGLASRVWAADDPTRPSDDKMESIRAARAKAVAAGVDTTKKVDLATIDKMQSKGKRVATIMQILSDPSAPDGEKKNAQAQLAKHLASNNDDVIDAIKLMEQESGHTIAAMPGAENVDVLQYGFRMTVSREIKHQKWILDLASAFAAYWSVDTCHTDHPIVVTFYGRDSTALVCAKEYSETFNWLVSFAPGQMFCEGFAAGWTNIARQIRGKRDAERAAGLNAETAIVLKTNDDLIDAARAAFFGKLGSAVRRVGMAHGEAWHQGYDMASKRHDQHQVNKATKINEGAGPSSAAASSSAMVAYTPTSPMYSPTGAYDGMDFDTEGM